MIGLSRHPLNLLKEENYKHVSVDITNFEELEHQLSGYEFEACIHAASDNKKFSETSLISTCKP